MEAIQDFKIGMLNISKYFPGTIALDNVNFDLCSGEVHVIVGENGAGKTTLVKILTGDLKKDSGEIKINDKVVEISNPKEAKLNGITSVQQYSNLVDSMSVCENLLIGHYQKDMLGLIDWKKMYSESDRFLKNIGFNDINAHDQVSSLTMARRKKLEITKAVYQNARIIIMDEPSAILPCDEIKKLFRIISELRSRNIGIVYISHHLEEVFQIGDRVTILKDGKKVKTLPVKEIDENELVRLMVGRKIEKMFPDKEDKRGKVVFSVKNLSTDYLKDISFDLRKGEIIGITGLVGAGRTELCEAIFGFSALKSGSILIGGKEIKISNSLSAVKNGIGFVTEDRYRTGLIMTMNIRSNISLVGYKKITKFGFIQRSVDKKSANELIKKLDIRCINSDQLAKNLSGGNQQKVALAKWMFTQSKILILDEPTVGVDVGAKVEIYDLMNKLIEGGISIIMVSSELPEIFGMSDRIAVMRNGRIVRWLLPGDTSEEEIILYASGIKK